MHHFRITSVILNLRYISLYRPAKQYHRRLNLFNAEQNLTTPGF